MNRRCSIGAIPFVVAALVPALAQQPPVQVTIEETQAAVAAAVVRLPLDPKQYVEYRYTGSFCYGLYVEGKLLCCGDGAIRPSVRIDGQTFSQQQANAQPLPGGADGRPRTGMQASSTFKNVVVTQILEVIPSKPVGKTTPGQKRRQDTLLTKYIIENRDTMQHSVGVRVRIDAMLVNNDGALFASPTTHPGEILNGVELRGPKLPQWLQILERPELQNPGFVAYFTLKVGQLEGPARFICTAHGAAENGWDVNVVPAKGDSDCVIYFDPVMIPPGGKRECGYAYGGGIAANAQDEGKVTLGFGGSFEPGKEFTITAYVDDPLDGQTLTLELHSGMERTQGKATQAVPVVGEGSQSVVLWKGRVDALGTHALRIRSSNGMTYTRTITVGRVER